MAMHGEDFTVNIEKLKDSETFPMWKFQIIIVLKSMGLFEIVNGQNTVTPDSSEAQKQEWQKKDARAQKILVTTMEKQPLTHILTCTTSKDMFEKMISVYERDTEQQKCTFMQEFFNYKYKSGQDIATHVSTLQNIAYKLNVLNMPINDLMIISKILATLPDSFKHFVSAWDSTPNELKTLTNLTARLLAEESRSLLTTEKEEPVAFKTNEKKKHGKLTYSQTGKRKGKMNNLQDKTNIRCFRCNEPGHFARSCTNSNDTETFTKCNICKKTNHIEKDCFFRKVKSKEEDKEKVSFMADTQSPSNTDLSWILDSGSSSHMANDVKLFKKITWKEIEIGIAKKEQKMKAKGIGIVETEKCILNNVLYIPELSKNLLSVSAIVKNGGQVIFAEKVTVIRKDNWKILAHKTGQGLWKVDLGSKTEEKAFLVDRYKTAYDWHRKLGHLGAKNLEKLTSLVDGLTLEAEEIQEIVRNCEICPRAKQVRTPFGKERKRATRPLELIHTDVCGPIEPSTWDKKNYILTFLDDFTHFTVIYLLERKYEVADKVKNFINMVEAKWQTRVSKLRSDNGREYMSKDLINWCETKGIILDYSTPYTPQLNGKAERLNRTLIEKTRALLADSEIDKVLWGEAARTAAYLLNRSPSETIESTPAELWMKERPNLGNLKLFGCTAFVKTLGQLKKLDDRSKSYIFVGYAPNGYRLYDKTNRKLIISRDVIFKEIKQKETESTKARILIHSEDIQEAEETNIEENFEDAQDLEENLIEEQEKSHDKNKNKEIATQEENKEGKEDRRSTRRQRKAPLKFLDYVFLTYTEAIEGPDKDLWREAIEDEKKSLEENKVWDLVSRTEAKNKKILSNKWIFRIKEDGRFKARLVVRGCEQKYGIDYEDTFSPVVNISSLRLVFALAVQKFKFVEKFDIKTAFLYGNLTEDVFMEIPEGYDKVSGKICKLKKALYGLKQAPLKWNQCFTEVLKSNDLMSTKLESCIYVNEKHSLILAIYVDDGIVVGSNKSEVEGLITNLGKNFTIIRQTNPISFLGIQLSWHKNKVTLKQSDYAEHIIDGFGLKDAKISKIPLFPINNYCKETEGNTTLFPYRECVGSLLYLANRTRPDLSFASSYVSRFLDKYSKPDVTNVKQILRYLKGMLDLGISFSKNNKTNTTNKVEELICFVDSDYAGDLESRKSTSGYIIFYSNGPICWKSKKQSIVALSSTEAEFIAAAECVKEIIFLRTLIEEITGNFVNVTLYIDNQSTIQIIKNGIGNKRSKHINVRYHFLNEKYAENILELKYCPSDEQIADVFTKPLGNIKFEKFKNLILSK